MRVVRMEISLYNLVINPSKKAAKANTGNKPIIIFTPSFAPCLNASILLAVPGNKKLFPNTNPAALASMIPVISNVPCTNTTNQKSTPKPLAVKNWSKVPSITAFCIDK